MVGITYFGGPGSIIKNNDIHNLYFGFYSNGVGNITIENNAIHNNGHYGLDPHTGTDSVARNNIVTHEEKGIVISESHNNSIYNNHISDSSRGIDLDKESFGNTIHHNVIENIPDPSEALHIEEGADANNTLYSNKPISFDR